MSCPDCFRGIIHEGTPQGKITKLHGLDAYIAEPAAGKEVKGFLVFIPDAFGWKFGNNQLLCDNLAAKSSYKVIMPDFMMGTSRQPRQHTTVHPLTNWTFRLRCTALRL